MPEHPVVAVVGLGAMGAPMSARLAAAGYPVRGFDVSAEARERAGAAGVTPAPSAAEAVAGADVVILMLPDSRVVEAVLDDPAVTAALAPRALVIDMSSSEPLRTRALAARLAERGVRMLDAPVSGGVRGAQGGTLTVMVGGDAADLEEARPVLEALGRVAHAGPIGAGHAVKALNNLLSATHLLSASEAVAAGRRFGLDPAVMLSIINGSSGRSGSTENKWPNFILTGTYDSGFALRLMVKDMRIAVGLAEQAGAAMELGADALEIWERCAADLEADADHTEIARWLLTDGGPP